MYHHGFHYYSTNNSHSYSRTRNPPKSWNLGPHELGSSTDPENRAMQESIINSVSEQTLQSWIDFREEINKKNLLLRNKLKIPSEKIDDKYHTFPEKKQSDYADAEIYAGSDASQPSRNEYDRSKYVLNRKVRCAPTEIITDSSQSPGASPSSDQIFIDDSQPSTTKRRWVISEPDDNSDKHVSSSENHQQREKIISPTEKTLQKSTSSNSSPTLKLFVTVPSSSNQECILHKYGHCIAPQICPFAHDGVVRKLEKKTVTAPFWQRKLPNISLCPGYPTLKCWDHKCGKRHILYPSDNI
ncbi:C3H1-type domain-containing protein [Caenorhabditis elegans]|uniref:C3H1-type domain-containing protein n=1 Tax=Caenorhabditis elegans TaxID=6239 RepID=O02103_CAEEL|nr:C3H1-type domain-containing protein [Caenorhabditis elegans]CCD65146.1 C3H1-type domain-containing protein [Caenorhabditis elegans]|eukprot:NP_491331.1 Uncharacterized protein CELE_C18E3.9 [Caenorhabditis elegans]